MTACLLCVLLVLPSVQLEEAETIRADKRNTVSDLTEKVLHAISAGGHDASFPVVVKDAGGLRLQGVISVNELEHCLGVPVSPNSFSHLLCMRER
jgi:hypothetical protein